jgi:hypothetical protein
LAPGRRGALGKCNWSYRSERFFEQSGNFSTDKLLHTPILLLKEKEDTIHVKIVDNAEQLLSFPDETPVMGQWHMPMDACFFKLP